MEMKLLVVNGSDVNMVSNYKLLIMNGVVDVKRIDIEEN